MSVGATLAKSMVARNTAEGLRLFILVEAELGDDVDSSVVSNREYPGTVPVTLAAWFTIGL